MCMLCHALRLHFVHQSDHIRSFFCHMAKWTIFGMNFARLHTAYAGFWKRQTTSFLDLRDFAGFWRIFALFCGIFAGKPWRFFWSQMVSAYAVVIFKAILGDTMQKLRFTAVSSQGFHRKWVWVAHLRSSWSRSNHPYGVQVKQVPSVHPGCWLKSCSEIPHSAFPGRWHTKVFVVPQVHVTFTKFCVWPCVFHWQTLE